MSKDPFEVPVMPFGKHKGSLVSDIPADYLVWLYDKAELKNDKIRAYIEANIELIREVAAEKKKKYWEEKRSQEQGTSYAAQRREEALSKDDDGLPF